MDVAEVMAGASSSVEALVAINEQLADKRHDLRCQLHTTRPAEIDELSQTLRAVLLDAKFRTDPLSAPSVVNRLTDAVADSELGIAGLWSLGRELDSNPFFVASRSSLVRAYLEAAGRKAGEGQFVLEVGDPISASVSHSFRVPATEWLDRFPGTWFVPRSARGIRVVADYRLAGAVDAATRTPSSPRTFATAHPFSGRDYLGHRSDDSDGSFPILPLPDDRVARRRKLAEAAEAAAASRAILVAFPELTGARDDVEMTGESWLSLTNEPGLALVGTFHEQRNGKHLNVARVVGRDETGKVEAVEFTKNFPMGEWSKPSRERISSAQTPELRILVGATGTVGLLVCRDALHHDLVSVVGDLSCSVVLIPALTPKAQVFEAPAVHLAVHGASVALFSNVAGATTTSMVTPAGGRAGPDGGHFVRRSTGREPGLCTYVATGKTIASQWNPLTAV